MRELDDLSAFGQIERIFASPDFATSLRAREFLRYVVNAVVQGTEEEISQYSIATDVFGRNGDFDPGTDPIVRIQAGRVRRSLEHYYLTDGANDALLITLPKGSYVPILQFRRPPESESALAEAVTSSCVSSGGWPTLLLTPFQILSSEPEVDHMGGELVQEIASELNNYGELRLLVVGRELDPSPTNFDVDFELRGAVSHGGKDLKISVQLLGGRPSNLIWANTYYANRREAIEGVFLEELARKLAVIIAGERGFIAGHITHQAPPGHKTVSPGPSEAISLYHQSVMSPSLDNCSAAMTALLPFARDRSEYGFCWGFLARLCAVSYALGLSGDARMIQDALTYAGKGLQLDPMDQRTRSILSYAYLVNDQVEEARHEAEAALALDPHSLFVLEDLGCLITLCGGWERGVELSRKAIRLNPLHRPSVHKGLWLDALRRGDYQEAYWQALDYQSVDLFWYPLMQAVALACQGHLDKAAIAAGQILKRKPDFLQRGRWLIGRCVKTEKLASLIEESLAKAGLRME